MANNRWGKALRGGMGAAGTGAGLLALGASGPVGWGVGLGLGALSLYDAFTGKSEEDQRSDRINELIAKRQAARQEALKRLSTETTTQLGNINRQTTGRVSRSASAIGRRAASGGRAVDQADFLTAQNDINNLGSDATSNLQDASLRASNAINTSFDNQILGLQEDQASLPIEPSITDYIGVLGDAGMQFAQNKDYLNAMGTKSAMPGHGTILGPGTTLPGYERTPSSNIGEITPVNSSGFDPSILSPYTPGLTDYPNAAPLRNSRMIGRVRNYSRY